MLATPTQVFTLALHIYVVDIFEHRFQSNDNNYERPYLRYLPTWLQSWLWTVASEGDSQGTFLSGITLWNIDWMLLLLFFFNIIPIENVDVPIRTSY